MWIVLLRNEHFFRMGMGDRNGKARGGDNFFKSGNEPRNLPQFAWSHVPATRFFRNKLHRTFFTQWKIGGLAAACVLILVG